MADKEKMSLIMKEELIALMTKDVLSDYDFAIILSAQILSGRNSFEYTTFNHPLTNNNEGYSANKAICSTSDEAKKFEIRNLAQNYSNKERTWVIISGDNWKHAMGTLTIVLGDKYEPQLNKYYYEIKTSLCQEFESITIETLKSNIPKFQYVSFVTDSAVIFSGFNKLYALNFIPQIEEILTYTMFGFDKVLVSPVEKQKDWILITVQYEEHRGRKDDRTVIITVEMNTKTIEFRNRTFWREAGGAKRYM